MSAIATFDSRVIMNQKTVSVSNISCGHCVATIERELGELDGVSAVSADSTARTVTVSWDDDAVSWPEVASLLDEIGYPASG